MVVDEKITALAPISPTTFDYIHYGEPSGKYHFDLNSSGKAISITIKEGNKVVKARLISDSYQN